MATNTYYYFGLALLAQILSIECTWNLPSYLSTSLEETNTEEYLIASVMKGDFREVVRLVQRNTSFANARDDADKTALIHAINREDIRMVRLLLQYGADANLYADTPTASPPSFYAIDVNNTEILKLLLEYCADPRVQSLYISGDGKGVNRTLLEAAEFNQNSKMVKLIKEYLDHGCGRCPAERRLFSLLNINWFLPETASRSVANISCPVSYGFTFGTWRCGPNSTWDDAPDLSPCRKIESLIKTPEGEPEDSLTTAAENLSRMADSINNITLLPGDLLAIDSALRSLQDQHINRDLLQFEPEAPALTKKYLTALINVTGKMLDEPMMWEAMPEESVKSVVTDIQENVVEGALTAARYLADNTTNDYPNDNLHVRVAHQPPSYYTFEQNRLYKHLVFPKTHLELPERFYGKYSTAAAAEERGGGRTSNNYKTQEKEESEFITVIFNSYRDLHCISNEIPCIPPGDNRTHIHARGQVNSGVIGAKIGFNQTWQAEGNDYVKVRFNHIYNGATYQLANPECVWWDAAENSWSSAGCHLYEFKPFHTICHCTHLTNLAVIMDINGLIDRETILYQMLQWITLIGCSISILSLAVCVACFFFLKKVKTKKSSSIRGNLCVCLLFAEVVLLMGLNASNSTICKLVAALLHYFFLATFTWSAIEAFNLYLALVKVFDTQCSLRKYFLLVGYFVPLIFVSVTLVITRGEGYGTEKMCWLAPERPIWIFAGSLAFIITLNLISFVLTMRIAWRQRPSSKVKSISQKTSSELAKRLSGSTAIFLLLGLTWFSGFFYMAEGTEMLAMVFTILNSLQGFGIFVFGVLFDDNIMKEAKEVIEHQLESKVSSSFKGTINPQRRGSYNFNTESEEITRGDTGFVKTGAEEEEEQGIRNHLESLEEIHEEHLEGKTKL